MNNTIKILPLPQSGTIEHMKLLVQRVKKASVFSKQEDKVVGEINKGLFILMGVGRQDTKEIADKLVDKIAKLRVMSDKNDKMNLSVKDVDAEILVVSQFTLYANTSDGNRPSFINAAEPKLAKELYEYFVEKLKEKDIKVSTGIFGDYMIIDPELDGPVTIIIEE
jgi:D-tyrosyl-tRNA(Tyr) deacylase